MSSCCESKQPSGAALHPLDILKEEHTCILQFSQSLQAAARKVQALAGGQEGTAEWEELRHTVHHLLEADSHHKREEQVLFPLLEEHGLAGPPAVMRGEHEVLRATERSLADLVTPEKAGESPQALARLVELADALAATISQHIFKENTILFPMASGLLAEEEWASVRQGFDRLGYCCFSPVQASGPQTITVTKKT